MTGPSRAMSRRSWVAGSSCRAGTSDPPSLASLAFGLLDLPAMQRVRDLQGRIDPVVAQGRDQVAVVGILGGLGDVGIGPGLIGLEDVLVALRGRQDDDRE